MFGHDPQCTRTARSPRDRHTPTLSRLPRPRGRCQEPRRREFARWIAAVVSVACVAGARAQPAVVHEFVSAALEDEVERAVAHGERGASESTELETTDAEPQPMVATAGDGRGAEAPGQRSAAFRPDRDTQLEGTLDYQAVFDPAIAPFKRVTSLDHAVLDADGRTPVLVVGNSARRPVPIEGGALAPDPRPRDRFTGEVVLDFARGRAVPLPSVSPESRILSVQTEPAVDIEIERDGADNYFAVARGALPDAEVKLTFVTDAPRAYFGGAIPRAAMGVLRDEVGELDPALRLRALRFAAELGIGPRSDLDSALSALTEHFRSFEESDTPPADSGDIYLDLARGKKGICRHRAYAFVVTAHALGIPARFVQNEAHAWVEVRLPKSGFRRIDLGGAASGLRASGLGNRTWYRPADPDRLPRPPAYEQSYSQSSPRDPAHVESATTRWVPDAPASAGPGLLPLLEAARGERPRGPLSIELEHSDPSVMRGQALRVRGRIRDGSGASVAGLRVEVALSAERRREHLLLGVTVSDASGAFTGAFDVPPDVDAGEYRLLVLTPGDERYLPAVAE